MHEKGVHPTQVMAASKLNELIIAYLGLLGSCSGFSGLPGRIETAAGLSVSQSVSQ